LKDYLNQDCYPRKFSN